MSDKDIQGMTAEELDEYVRTPCPTCGQRPDEVYCTACGSCGDNYCCHPGRCVKVRCKYGDVVIDQYERSEEESSRWYLVLGQLGVYEQFKITEEIAKQVGDAKFGNKTLRQIIDGLLRPILPEYDYDVDEYTGPWSPIETAPKDGTHVLTWSRGDGIKESWWGSHFSGSDIEGFGGNSHRYIGDYQPTYWMPIPMPPEE